MSDHSYLKKGRESSKEEEPQQDVTRNKTDNISTRKGSNDRIEDNNTNNCKSDSFVEKVLVLQGGGSLGAYECGVCNILYKQDARFHVFAGSSIGSINCSILASAQNGGKDPAKVLRDFWHFLSEDIPYVDSPSLPQLYSSFPITKGEGNSSLVYLEKMNAIMASMYTAFFGTPKAFMPRWFVSGSYFDVDQMRYNMPMDGSRNSFSFFPFAWSYLYDSSPLKKTLSEFIDFNTLKKNPDAGTSENSPARLIITSTDIKSGKTVVFDNQKMDISVEKILAGTSYPFYGIKWIKIGETYLWDGSLLSNTPLTEVLFASPSIDKEFFVVDVFPREQDHIPENMVEVWHRARDILFLDKTDKSLQMAAQKRRYISLLKEMNKIISSQDSQIDESTRSKLKKMHEEFEEIVNKKGAIVQNVIRVTRSEKIHYLFEDADFSKHRITELIHQGEQDCKNTLKNESQKTKKQKQEGGGLPQEEKEQKRQI